MSAKAWEQAVAEGLRYFWAHLYTGETVKFVGQTWEDGGFTADPDETDRPLYDGRGNTVRSFSIENLNPDDAAHVAQVAEWWEQG